jgi:hypothetical protein
MIEIMSEIHLVHGAFLPESLGPVLKLALDEWHWLDSQPQPDELDEFFSRARQGITADLSGSESAISAALPSAAWPFGYLLWSCPSTHPSLSRDLHRAQIAEAMELLDSPLAWATSEKAWRSASWRLGPPETGRMTSTVKGIGKGLKGPFWRMWFREPYLTFLNLAQGQEALRFVELFEDPALWKSPAAVESMETFRRLTRENAFYDPKEPDRKLATPEF